MKHWTRSAVLGVLIAAVCSVAWTDEPVAPLRPPGGQVIHPQHPRLFFRKEDLSRVRARCATTHAYWYRRMKSWLDTQAELDGGSGVEHAMLYQLTGDERYAKAALAATEINPEPGVYDLLYETLDPETRKRYGRRLMPGPLSKYHTEYTKAYFFTSANADKCLALWGDGIAEGEDRKNVDLILWAAPRTFKNYADRTQVAGGWMCSFHCGCFVRNLIGVYHHWTVATGDNRFTDSYAWAAQATWMAQHLIPGRWTLVPLSSAWWGEGKTPDRAALPEVAHFTRSGSAQFFINHYRRFVQWEYADDNRGYGYFPALDPKDTGLGYWRSGLHNVYRMILCYDPELPERKLSGLQLTAFYPTWGRACMRTNWGDDAIFAVFKCGWHQGGEPPDLDDGNFAIYHKGNLVLDNSWNFKRSSVQSVNQNTITVLDPDEKIRIGRGRSIKGPISPLNDGGQSFYDAKQTGPFDRGKVIAFEDKPEYLYVAGDATKSYHPKKMKAFTRQFVYIKPDVFVIFDRVESTRPEFEKRFVLNMRTKPEPVGTGIMTDASELLFPEPELKPIFPYKYGNFRRDTVPGFHQPQYERFAEDWQTVGHKADEPFGKVIASKVPNRKLTLKFESRYGREEIRIVHNTGPQYGEVQWSLDNGKRRGTFNQKSAAPAYQQNTLIVGDLAKGEHTLTLVAPTGLMNVEVFEIKFGGRMFVRTLLPAKAKTRVVEGFPESGGWHQRDRYGRKRRYRLEVRPPKPAKQDYFLHVIQIGDRDTHRMMRVVHGDMEDDEHRRVLLVFPAGRREIGVYFNRTGPVGGGVNVSERPAPRIPLLQQRRPGEPIDTGTFRKLPFTDKVKALPDAVLETTYARAKAIKHYDYETADLKNLGAGASIAKLRAALKDEKWYTRYHAARMLGMKRAKAAEQDLVAALADADVRVAAASAEALGRLGSVAATDALVAKLAAPDATLRFNAAWALGRIAKRTPAIVAALRGMLADADGFVVYAAAQSLGQLGPKADAATTAALVDVLNRKDHVARAKAAETLGTLKAGPAVPALMKLAREGDASERLAALHALGTSGDAAARAFLTSYALTETHDAVNRLAAARALVRAAEDRTGLQALVTLDDARIRRAAVVDLVRLGDGIGRKLLIKDLDSRSDAVRQGAAWALYKLDDKRGLAILARDLTSTQYGTRTGARRYCAYINDVLGDKQPLAGALIDVIARFVDDAEKGEDPGGNWVHGRLNIAAGMLKNVTGRTFWNWHAYRRSKEARMKFRKSLLDWWAEHGKSLPEVRPTVNGG